MKRLERVLAGRRARLAETLGESRRRSASAGPIGSLQRYGYPAALLLVLTAALPTVIGFAFRRRRLLVGAAANGLVFRKWQKRFDSLRSIENDR